jgi:hypothetical protein
VFELFDRWKKEHFFNNLRFLAVPVLAFQGSLDEDDGKTSRVLFTRFTGLKVLGLSLEPYWYIRTHTGAGFLPCEVVRGHTKSDTKAGNIRNAIYCMENASSMFG